MKKEVGYTAVISVTITALLAGFLLSFVYSSFEKDILANNEKTVLNGVKAVIEGADELEGPLKENSSYDYYIGKKSDGTVVGYAMLASAGGYNGQNKVLVGFDANAEVILNQLYQHTQLQETFGVIMLALVNGHPRILNLKQVLHYYIKHQEDVIRRRTQYELTKAQARAHILEGLTIALDHLDPIIETIRKSPNGETAKEILMSDYTLTEKQAQAILDLRLQRLTGLEREKIETEYLEVLSYIDNLNAILADEHKILNIIKEELSAVKAKFGDARRTQITDDTSDVDLADLIAEENVVITLTHNNYIKRIPLTTYRNQKRGGRGVTGMGTKEEDYVENMIITSTHNTILFFTNKGLVYQLKGYEIPESGRTAKGTAIVNLLPLAKDESITAIIPIEKFADDKYLFMATRNGVVKKTVLSAYDTNRKKTGLIAISLKDDDELISVKLTDGNRYIIIGTRDGMSISFNEQDVRPMGRNARGVIGIKLKGDDKVIDMDNLRKNCEVLTVTENGYGKRTPTEEYRAQSRGGIGLINIKVTEKTGFVVGVKVVNENQEFMLISTEGIVIRSNINEVSVINRNTQGVKVMNMDDNDKVAAVAAFEDDENNHE